jgi:uncharacterized repeat protein (TIGR03803 family)
MRSGSRKLLAHVLTTASIVVCMAGPVCCRTKYAVLHEFGAANDGAIPSGPLFLGPQNRLYGVAGGGPGQNGYGVVFELTRQTNGNWKETILHVFASGDGSPWGAFVQDRAGVLYGTTAGGPISKSEVFALSPTSSGWDFSVLYANGAGPGLLMDEKGNLYGAIGPGDYFNVGAIGDLLAGPDGWDYAQLYPFCSQQHCDDGYGPTAPPVWDGKGNLFGTTRDGGIGQPACWTAFGCGVIYELTLSKEAASTYHVLHRFASWPTDGQTPNGGLVRDSSGSFYGTTGLGGDKNHGTVFKITFNGRSWRKTVLFDFPNCGDGCAPSGTLVFDRAGSLYGAGDGGNSCGPAACGLIFKLTPQKNGKWKYSIVHKFKGTDGNFPLGVIVDGKGNLFGPTKSGGTYNAGVAFEITQ